MKANHKQSSYLTVSPDKGLKLPTHHHELGISRNNPNNFLWNKILSREKQLFTSRDPQGLLRKPRQCKVFTSLCATNIDVKLVLLDPFTCVVITKDNVKMLSSVLFYLTISVEQCLNTMTPELENHYMSSCGQQKVWFFEDLLELNFNG